MLQSLTQFMVALLQLHHSLKVHYSVLSIRNLKSEIPNITDVAHYGGAWAIDYNNEWSYGTPPSGAFAVHAGVAHFSGQHAKNSNDTRGYDFYASRCSDRYGNYTEVNPLYNSCKFFIKYLS